MGRSIRSKKVRANKAALRARYAPKELEKLKQTVAKLPLTQKDEMETEETEEAEAEVAAPAEDTADVSMGGEGAPISKSQIKKKLANKNKQKSKLKKKNIKAASKKKGRLRV